MECNKYKLTLLYTYVHIYKVVIHILVHVTTQYREFGIKV